MTDIDHPTIAIAGKYGTDLKWANGRSVEIYGPEHGEMEVHVETSFGDQARAYFPVEYMANHLRLRGWTVTPPDEEVTL